MSTYVPDTASALVAASRLLLAMACEAYFPRVHWQTHRSVLGDQKSSGYICTPKTGICTIQKIHEQAACS